MKPNVRLKILCLSFWTPPIVRPQSILIGKMIPEWINQGLEPVIMTYDICGDWRINATVYKMPSFKLATFFSRLPLISTINLWFYYRKIAKQAGKIIKKHDINVVFSFSNPQDSNIIGAMLRKRTGVKFISHFSDPWYDNIYKSFSFFGAKKVLFQEKFIIKNSDGIVFITEEARGLVMKKYPELWKEKTEIIPHCFDLKDYPEVSKTDPGKFTISYVGAFYKQRNPELLFRALQKIISKQPSLNSKFKIELIGAANDYAGYSAESIKKMADFYGLKDNIEIVPPVNYRESLKYMKLSDCLVVIDADVSNSPFLPSKVVDYAGSGNTILGITPQNSPTAKFIKNLGCESFSYDQIYELAEYLLKLISGQIKIKINKEFLEQYDVKNTTARLINIFKEVLEKK